MTLNDPQTGNAAAAENAQEPLLAVALSKQHWKDILYILDQGLADIANFTPNESDGYSSDEISKRERILQHEAFDALFGALPSLDA